MEEFFKDADLLIHDGQYTQTEYDSGKRGWGHSPIEYAVAAAGRANVKRLAICHHDPVRTIRPLPLVNNILNADFEIYKDCEIFKKQVICQ